MIRLENLICDVSSENFNFLIEAQKKEKINLPGENVDEVRWLLSKSMTLQIIVLMKPILGSAALTYF